MVTLVENCFSFVMQSTYMSTNNMYKGFSFFSFFYQNIVIYFFVTIVRPLSDVLASNLNMLIICWLGLTNLYELVLISKCGWVYVNELS